MPDSSSPPSLLLVDGSAYLYRSYHVHTSMADSRGRPTGAIFGVINTLQSQMRRTRPDYVAVIMDAPGKNFRHRWYPDYKAQRKPMDPELREQIEPIKKIIRALGLPFLSVPEVEADDVIGTLARQGEAAGMEVMILSGDKDMAQLVNDHVTLHNIDRAPMDADSVFEKFQVRPEQIVDYLALAGDASDNIPGVPKVGAKTAAQWLAKYDSMDNLIKHADEIPGKVGENLRAALERLPLYNKLVTIRCDLELEVTAKDLQPKKQDRATLEVLYREHELRRFLRDLDAEQEREEGATNAAEEDAVEAQLNACEYVTVLNKKDLKTWIARCRKAKVFALDIETTSKDSTQARLVGLSIATEPGQAAYIPVGHTRAHALPQLDEPEMLKQLDPTYVLEQMKGVLTDPKLTRVGQNLKYDRIVLQRHGADLADPIHDTMLESYLHYNAPNSRHNLDDLSRTYLNEETVKYKTVVGTGKSERSFDQVPIDQATPYAAEDADMALRLHHHLWPMLSKKKKLKDLYEKLELPLSQVLGDMERAGVTLNTKTLKAQSIDLNARRAAVCDQIFSECGHEFNLESPREVGKVLFEERGLEPGRKTAKGSASTNAEVLEELAKTDAAAKMILEYRQLSKLLSTYIDKLPKMVLADTGRLHTSFLQAGTATGRLASSDPNLQNIPIRTADGRRIRDAFVPAKGCTLIAADYSQIELRVMAHFSEDPTLCQAFLDGADVHRATAAEVFGTPLEKVTDDQRRTAKMINFGLIYGMGAFGLANRLNIPRGEAEAYVQTYFERYPQVRAYMEVTREKARETGGVETLWGRRIHLDALKSKNYQRRQYAERLAINAPIQGTAADIMKKAMIETHQWLGAHHPDCQILLQVHDELVLEAPKAKAPALISGVQERMEGAAQLDVPMQVEAKSGCNWNEAH